MTIKHDCKMCQGEGIVTKVFYPPIDWGRMPKTPSPSYQTVKDFCDCVWGKRAKEIEDRINTPGYVNPLASMTDAEILRAIDHATNNQRSVDEEFNV